MMRIDESGQDLDRDRALAKSEVRGIEILLPKAWYEFDIRPEARDDNIRRAVCERIQRVPELADREAELVKALRRLARDAWHGGVIYCGCLAEVREESPLLANLTVAVIRARDERGQILPTDPQAILSALKPVPKGRRPTDMWREAGVVELPGAGYAARSQGIEDIDFPDDSRVARMAMMQTFVPVPGADDRVVAITGSTPQLELVEPMLALFDGITSTFRFLDR
jgi:hypothetical protein